MSTPTASRLAPSQRPRPVEGLPDGIELPSAWVPNRAALIFWRRVAIVADDACWLWTGAYRRNGYGVHVQQTAHRVAWALANGRPPAQGLVIRHACDVKGCVNPRHLIEGTHLQNVQDACERGQIYWARLTDDNVREIRRSPETCAALGRRFGVSESLVAGIRRGDRKRHVSP